jgi:hypothetical protein
LQTDVTCLLVDFSELVPIIWILLLLPLPLLLLGL